MSDDEPQFTPEQIEHIKAMFDAMQAVSDHRDWLIADELKQQLPEFEAKEAAAHASVNEAYEFLKEPLSVLDNIISEISRAEGESGEWQRKLAEAEEMGERVTARSWFIEWNNRLDELNSDREILEKELEPYRRKYKELQEAADIATAQREGLELNLAIPTFALGQGTTAYRLWYLETGAFIPVVLSGDVNHQAWNSSIDFLDVVCNRSGYRTNHLSSAAEQVKRSIENYAAAKQSADTRPGAPSAAEIMRDNFLAIEEKRQQNVHIEDYRTRVAAHPSPRITPHIPKP